MKQALFKIANYQDPDITVSWSFSIDEDGDLLIRANGVIIAYINSRTGEVKRITTSSAGRSKVPTLAFDDEGRIAIAR
jgi:hypothetical protein